MLDNKLYALVIPLIEQGMTTILGATYSQIMAENNAPLSTEAGFGIAADAVAIDVVQAYNPTFQGTPSVPTIFVYKVGDQRVGFPEKKTKWVTNNTNITTDDGRNIEVDPGGLNLQADGLAQSVMRHWEVQRYLTTFQVSALATQNPSTPMQLTASDLVNYAASVLQSDTFISAVETQGVGVLRIGEIRNTPFVDDRGQFEFSPSFDVTFAHNQIIISTTPIITSETFRFYRV